MMSVSFYIFFFFNDTATTEIYTLSLHDALPICRPACRSSSCGAACRPGGRSAWSWDAATSSASRWPRSCCRAGRAPTRSEEHTSELQSRQYLVCRLLLEKKKKNNKYNERIYN